MFDLQRFAVRTDTGFYGEDEAAGHESQQDGDLFEVSSDGTKNKRYFSNIYAAINYVYDAPPATDGATGSLYGNDNDGYTATIKLLGDVTNGQPFKLLGNAIKKNANDAELVSGLSVQTTNLTFDLNDHTYTFAESFDVNEINNKSRGISIGKGNLDPNYKPTSKYTFKNGTITTADKTTSGTLFQQIIKNYDNLELNNVTVDATNLKGQGGGESFGAVTTTYGTLTLSGNTTFKIQSNSGDNIYYAIGGTRSEYTSHGYQNGGPNIIVDLDENGYIPNIGLATHVNTKYTAASSYYPSGWIATAFPKDKFNVQVKKGSVGEITLDGVAVDGAGYTGYSEGIKAKFEDRGRTSDNVTLKATYENISLGSDAHSLATFGLFEQDTTSADASKYLIYQKNGANYPYTFGIEGWNRAEIGNDKEYNYVAPSLTSAGAEDTQGRGEIVLNVTSNSAIDTTALALDKGHKIFGIPTGSTPTLKDNSAGYKLATLRYNNAGDAVTVSTDNADAVLYSGDYTLGSGTATTAGSGIISEKVTKINASDISVAVSIIANTLGNEISDGEGDNYIAFGATGTNQDTLIYGGGADSIANYGTGDIVKLTSDIDPVTAGSSITATDDGDLILGFGKTDSITFKGQANIGATNFLNGVSVESANGRNTYIYTKQSIVQGDGLTLTSAATTTSYDVDSSSTFYTIDGAAVAHALTLSGNGDNNYLIGSSGNGNSLYGRAGNDTLKGGSGADIFRYTEGKDVIEGYGAGDSLNIDVSAITSAKVSGNKLIFSTNKTGNTLTFNNMEVAEVSLTSGEILGKAGYSKDSKLTLFADAKGSIKAADYNATGGIDASKVKSHNVTLVGASGDGEYIFAKDNKKADLFQYGGGAVSVENYESGKDKINFGDFAMNGFAVGTGTDTNVTLKTAEATNYVVLKDAKGKEINFRDDNSSGSAYTSMVLAASGVIYDKEKKPTKATLLSGVANNAYTAVDEETIKKVYVDSGASAVSITANNEKMTVDAGDATKGVSIIGGTGDNKVTLGGGADIYEYHGGKDIVTGFSTGDSISLGDFDSQLLTAKKITVGKSDVTFKFVDSGNTLNIKGVTDGTVQFVNKSMTFDNNAIIDATNKKATLTAGFTGSYKTDKATYVDGSNVSKSLTFKGSAVAETLMGGTKKTTFRGGGGADSLVGGSGSDTFFYAKGDRGDAVIANFDYANDKIKIANGTITKITKDGSSVKFTMNNGKGTSNIGSFSLNSYSNNGTETTITEPDNIIIKANNTYYWFATQEITDGNDNVLANAGDLITSDSRVKASEVSALDNSYSVVDLSYSTNLVKATVAKKIEGIRVGSSNRSAT